MIRRLIILLHIVGCDLLKEEDVYGCTDKTACNFNTDATIYVPNSCNFDYEICACMEGNSCMELELLYENQ